MNGDGKTTPAPGHHFSPLRAALWLALVLVAAKAALFFDPELEFVGTPLDASAVLGLAMVSCKDVLFALCAGLLGEGLWRLRRDRLVRHLLVGAYAVCALYAVIALGVFRYFNRPLSYDLIRFMHGGAAAWSSVKEQLTVPITLALVGVPLAVVTLVAWDARRRPRAPRWALGVAAVWIVAGGWQVRPQAEDWKLARQDALRLAISPHFELLRSTFTGLTGSKPAFPKDFSPEEMEEFRSIGGRHFAGTENFQMPPGVVRPHNVIIVTLESVGTKYMSLYGSRYDTTPNLVAEGKHAAVYRNIYAHASQTYCSFRSINFSIYPGLPWLFAPYGGRPMAPAMATVLRAQGHRSIYLHNGSLEWSGDSRMLTERYERAEDYADWKCEKLTSWGAADRCTIDRLIAWLDEKKGAPFLAHCWTDQTHDPYPASPGMEAVDFFHGQPPPPHAAALSRYLNVLREADRQVGRIFAALRERGLADDTLVVVTGDHGEAFGDPHSQRGHGLTVYEEEMNVPLMLWNPRLFPGGQRLDAVGGHVDVNPTIADILGVKPSGEWQGHSLFDPARPDSAFFMATISAEYLFGLRDGPWKYVLDATSGRDSLHDLAADPLERENLAAREPDRCRRMRQRVSAWVAFEEDFLRARRD